MTDVRQPDSEQAVSQLSQSLAQAAESHRLLAEEMTSFAKDESLRFANLRLERNGSEARLYSRSGLDWTWRARRSR